MSLKVTCDPTWLSCYTSSYFASVFAEPPRGTWHFRKLTSHRCYGPSVHRKAKGMYDGISKSVLSWRICGPSMWSHGRLTLALQWSVVKGSASSSPRSQALSLEVVWMKNGGCIVCISHLHTSRCSPFL